MRQRVNEVQYFLNASDLKQGSLEGISKDEEQEKKIVEMDKNIEEAMAYLKIKPPLTRQTLIQLSDSDMLAGGGLKMTYISATEAILFCRGPGLDHSETYDQARLAKWLVDNLKILKMRGSP